MAIARNLPQFKAAVLSRAIAAFDKSTAVVMIIVWAAALLFTVLAYSSVMRSMHAREDLAAAEASTPLTPRVNMQNLPEVSLKEIAERLQRRYGAQLQISVNAGKLQMTAKDASAFNTWLTAVTYLDVIRPDLNWRVEDFCVGTTCSGNLMSVSLVAQSISFDVPTPTVQ